MIRYDVALSEIENAVRATSDSWMDRAAERTAAFVRNKKFKESSSIWSEVKPVFMAAQSNKCVFCERQFESQEYGRIEHDLEHFRPKSSVTKWPRRSDGLRYDFGTGGSSANGYYWLAYDLSNYAAACGVCNSTLKSNCFPIAETRATAPDHALTGERPHLCYPIGDGDDDPETLVTFQGIVAVPKSAVPHDRRRGQVIIDFFRLNRRQQLQQERARMIALLGTALGDIDRNTDVSFNRRIVEQLLSGVLPHTACCRAFRQLWDADRDMATTVHRNCRALGVGLPSP